MICATLHLHAYQPPTQPNEIIRRIFNQSYLPIIEAMEQNPEIVISLDIAKSLGERLYPSFLSRINARINAGQIELVNTAAYHYLLPLEPYRIALEQLKINQEFYRKHFPNARIHGAFPPELAISPATTFALSASGGKWTLMDDFASVIARKHLPEDERVPHAWIPEAQYGQETPRGLRLLLRSRFWSEIISNMRYPDNTQMQNGNEFAQQLIAEQTKWVRRRGESPMGYISLAVDFETFGHHHPNAIARFLIPFFRAIAKHQDACALLPSRIVGMFPKRGNFPIAAGSWSSSEDDLKNENPFPLWNHPDNPFHRAWNNFKNEAFTATRHLNNTENPELANLMQTAFYSCSPWQYSHNNKKVAAWCLPLFQRISELIPPSPMTQNLPHFVEEMRRLTA